ncbi:hypothetical protein D3C85_1916560 [compost metagenome]
MGASNEIHAAVLDQLNVASNAGSCYGVAPSGMILMDICTDDVVVLAVQEKSILGIKHNRANPKIRFILVI